MKWDEIDPELLDFVVAPTNGPTNPEGFYLPEEIHRHRREWANRFSRTTASNLSKAHTKTRMVFSRIAVGMAASLLVGLGIFFKTEIQPHNETIINPRPLKIQKEIVSEPRETLSHSEPRMTPKSSETRKTPGSEGFRPKWPPSNVIVFVGDGISYRNSELPIEGKFRWVISMIKNGNDSFLGSGQIVGPNSMATMLVESTFNKNQDGHVTINVKFLHQESTNKEPVQPFAKPNVSIKINISKDDNEFYCNTEPTFLMHGKIIFE